MDNMEIIVKAGMEYGTLRIRPVCSKAKGLARLMGQKTFTEHQASELEKIGIKVTDQPQEPVWKPQQHTNGIETTDYF